MDLLPRFREVFTNFLNFSKFSFLLLFSDFSINKSPESHNLSSDSDASSSSVSSTSSSSAAPSSDGDSEVCSQNDKVPLHTREVSVEVENDENKNAGGLLALVRKDATRGWHTSFSSVLPGRVGFLHFPNFPIPLKSSSTITAGGPQFWHQTLHVFSF